MLDINELMSLPTWYDKLRTEGLPVYIYGMGDGCEKVLAEFSKYGIECAGIFTSDDFKRDREFHGFRLTTLSDLEASVIDFSAVLAFGTDIPEVLERIKGISDRHLLVCPDTPVAGDDVFDQNGLLSREEDIQKVYSLLSDEKSKNTFINILKFKITGDIEYLKEYSDKDEPFSILSLGEDEVYCDLGAYTGDTVRDFLSHTKGIYSHIYAFEPSRKNFQKCVRNCSGLDNITLINAAVSDADREDCFSSGAGRQQMLSQHGIPTAVRSLDSVLGGKKASYIKYDVEGEEKQAIIGSRRTIEKYSPKLRISIYHRPYDLIDIPLQINEMLPNSSLYMRRQRYCPAWDTELIVIPQKTGQA